MKALGQRIVVGGGLSRRTHRHRLPREDLRGRQRVQPDDGRAVPENNGRNVHAATGNRSHCKLAKDHNPRAFCKRIGGQARRRDR